MARRTETRALAVELLAGRLKVSGIPSGDVLRDLHQEAFERRHSGHRRERHGAQVSVPLAGWRYRRLFGWSQPRAEPPKPRADTPKPRSKPPRIQKHNCKATAKTTNTLSRTTNSTSSEGNAIFPIPRTVHKYQHYFMELEFTVWICVEG